MKLAEDRVMVRILLVCAWPVIVPALLMVVASLLIVVWPLILTDKCKIK